MSETVSIYPGWSVRPVTVPVPDAEPNGRACRPERKMPRAFPFTTRLR